MEEFLASCGAAGPLALTVSRPDRDDVEVALDQPFALVGRHRSNCLRLKRAGIGPRQAYLQIIAGRVLYVDLGGSPGVRHHGARRPYGWLGSELPIEIGPFTLRLNAPLSAPVPRLFPFSGDWDPLADRVSNPQLMQPVWLEVGGAGIAAQQWHMSRVVTLVGRSPSCRVRLADTSVSAHHCSLVGTPSGVWVVDLLSRTGTWVNGRPVRWAPVAEGDLLQVGPYRLRCRYEPAEHDSDPALLRRGLTAAGRSEFNDSKTALEPLRSVADQFQLTQQQMVDLFQTFLLELAEVFAASHQDQMVVFERELERVRRVACELEGLQQAQARRGASSYLAGHGTEQADTATRPGRTAAAALGGDPPANSPEGAATPCRNDSGASVPPEQARPDIHAWLNDRFAALQQDRQNVWRKMFGSVLGR